MKQNYTHITVILDRTGSMEDIRDDTIGGFNSYLEKSKELPGIVTFTLVQFDSQDPYEILQRFVPIAFVPPLTRETYIPRATTPLYDAIGYGINDLENCISELKEGDRPAKVIFVIITDGQENASHKFSKKQIEKMIKKHSDKDGWQFIFLSADLEAMSDAQDIGIKKSASKFFLKTSDEIEEAYDFLFQTACDYVSSEKDKDELD
ncbi:MAG TPA: vWA domain-containing protein [Candidatus Sumerlaeota bacterium]|nr:MAG: hypothetical protein BWY12_00069 [candidate division BRC1 bacterium ADurb.Bin183]HOE62558.1 vWA domain-containing protein [Candidatus Sumerlaeota bacterium]HRR30848.1 vWA domain-containing protein [Candidatus Sumerlaeia bacterium]HON49318.1 vWA domain-containing protein [Candidatus Sumerlaeota bacterium]HOR64934.1 vWA domain-containing protein [Candidatus Sumerlaeota bacterium]